MDRNWPAMILPQSRLPSLSARRAWIEIYKFVPFAAHVEVALRKESVDRNKKTDVAGAVEIRRSPQGERG